MTETPQRQNLDSGAAPSIAGVIVVDKPPAMTSARVVASIKRALPAGVKVGHAGTLDRFATGVLLILVGRATKSCEGLMNEPKQYDVTIKLGATTVTGDPESAERVVTGASPISLTDV